MAEVLRLFEELAHTAVGTGLNAFWQSALLAGLVGLALKWAKSLNAATRYGIWCATLAIVAALPLGRPLWAGIEINPQGEAISALVPGVVEFNRLEQTKLPPSIAADGQIPLQPSTSTWAVDLPQGPWVLWGLALWLAGALWGGFRLGQSYLYMRRLRYEAAPLPKDIMRRLAPLLERGRPVRLYHSRMVATPLAVGLLHPAILLPEAAARQLDRRQLEQVILHEVAHISRWDDWTNFVQRLLQAALWWIPAVWYIGRRLELEREIACDDWVVAQTGAGKSYAQCLTRLVELSMGLGQPVLGSGAVLKRGHLVTRVKLLLDRQRNTAPQLFKGRLLVYAPALMAVALGLAACDTFAPPKITDPGTEVEAPKVALSPDQVMENLSRAMNQRDKELYEDTIDADFWFSEYDCLGELVLENGREQVLEIMGTRDGDNGGILNLFRTFEFDFSADKVSVELAADYPQAFAGDPNGHPDEDWQVFRGRTQMLMIDDEGNGFRVLQTMDYKVRRGEDGIWRIIRWQADPLSGDCGAAKTANQETWSRAKIAQR